MELNERDSDRFYGAVFFYMRNTSQQGSTLLIWMLMIETILACFHENCKKYWINFTEALITLCPSVKYYICKDASLGQTVSEKVKQCMVLKSLCFCRFFELLCDSKFFLILQLSVVVVTLLLLTNQSSEKLFLSVSSVRFDADEPEQSHDQIMSTKM